MKDEELRVVQEAFDKAITEPLLRVNNQKSSGAVSTGQNINFTSFFCQRT